MIARRSLEGSPRGIVPALLCVSLLACGEKDSSRPVPDESPAAEPAPRPERADRDRPVDEPAATGPPGRVIGLVAFEGTPPERRELSAGAAGCEHLEETPLSETVIVEDGRLANVFVYVSKGLSAEEKPAEAPEPLVLDQLGCVYAPHVSAARTGQTILVRNSDPTAHNVHVIAKRNSSTNRTQSAGMTPLELVFEEEEVPVTFVCDIHPWMKAFVCVQDHPYFAVSGSDGRFEIAGLPPGRYTLRAWHEKYPGQRAEVDVPPGGELEVSFTFSE